MKKLVIYYSLEGNTKLMAESIAAQTQADILKIETVKEVPAKGFRKYFWGVKGVLMKQSPALKPLNKDPQDYDLLFIGTPVWASSYAPPLKTFMKTNPVKGKKIALFCCHQGMRGAVFAKMRQAFAGNEIISEIDFHEPLKDKTQPNIIKAKEWARGLIQEKE